MRYLLFRVVLSQIWVPWRNTLVIVNDESVVYWHSEGFNLFWRYERKKRPENILRYDTIKRSLLVCTGNDLNQRVRLEIVYFRT